MPGAHFAAPLHCAHCGAQGEAVWEPTDSGEPSRNLLGLTGPFHAETGRAAKAMIVCSNCDEIQPD